MATDAAFQANAFQNDAFQIGDAPPPSIEGLHLGGPTIYELFPTYTLAYSYNLSQRTD